MNVSTLSKLGFISGIPGISGVNLTTHFPGKLWLISGNLLSWVYHNNFNNIIFISIDMNIMIFTKMKMFFIVSLYIKISILIIKYIRMTRNVSTFDVAINCLITHSQWHWHMRSLQCKMCFCRLLLISSSGSKILFLSHENE